MTETVAWIALSLSILNTLTWIVFVITVRKVFKQVYPLFNSLTSTPMYATMVPPDQTEVSELKE